ncbi:PhnB protein [Anseongella ginsenosidimutans]|uniref:PhnB protein n=1 Tax=Anseongella ginsenosidimutans TaxID=496056 RepID=A0A4R3KNS1_9SPHI|nr:VOC family protein [Anseongella ginsenosidimutans]QEC53844.1 VOC family protein [Anseongella ginsenosidimutans]TCS86220.1 PhnB protein [Anseongella ginsenosidimutans]
MKEVSLNAYLLFDGNCREAMVFYQQLFGGELKMQTYGEVNHSCPAATKDSIMHASLMGGDIDLMASDDPEAGPQGRGKISLALGGTNEEKLRRMFDGLAEGGKIIVPLRREVWGDIFGVVNDKFGINWMMNISADTQ